MFGRLFRKKSFDADLDEELQAHLDIEARLLMDRGLSQQEALTEARRSFGNRTQIAESARESWGWQWLERLLQDLRYAARTLRRSPAFGIGQYYRSPWASAPARRSLVSPTPSSFAHYLTRIPSSCCGSQPSFPHSANS